MRFYQSVKSPMRRIINHLTQTNNTGSVKIENPFLLMCAQTILVRWGNPVSEEPMIHIIEWLAIHSMSPNIPVVHEVSITWLKTNHCWGWKSPSSHLWFFYQELDNFEGKKRWQQNFICHFMFPGGVLCERLRDCSSHTVAAGGCTSARGAKV